ncbi:XTP/dITP diphosphohydrolase [Motilibacter rhizosphaerae]|uniref:dITP/XTP pyrophosphatase n=1 Tax=Motilibacter rhizosphaerae TaxID=598652 RepID=A0A4Q7NS67_9ACTN|nr:RdgB/HAM1 family non-canonical purine NTP pyrophosphatase [Motilibacter rhizosphaerae]RZS89963.1 XTP/dITP diphosphohydrolase [Motilibacter rhizosphaerae]
MTRVLLSTRNAHKVEEVRRILAATEATGVEVVGLDGYDVPEVVEDGLTFTENALLKARAAVQATGLPAIADDSGICVDVLGGMPGIFSARWSGRHGADDANLDLLLAQVAEVPDDRLGAHFTAAVVLVRPDGSSVVEEGIVRGHLVRERRGAGGFGYDPVFVADESGGLTTAELGPERKDAISHRGRALRALAPSLVALAGQPT